MAANTPTTAWHKLALARHQSAAGSWQFIPVDGSDKKVAAAGCTGRHGSALPPTVLQRHLNRPGIQPGVRIPTGVVGIDYDTWHNDQEDTPETQTLWRTLPATWSVGAREPEHATRFYRVPSTWTADSGRTKWSGGELLVHWHRYQMLGQHPTGRLYRLYRPDGTEADPTEWPKVDDLTRLDRDHWQTLIDSDKPQKRPAAKQFTAPPKPPSIFDRALDQLQPIADQLGGTRERTRVHAGKPTTGYTREGSKNRKSYETSFDGTRDERVRFWSKNVIPGADYDDTGNSSYDRLDIACLLAHGYTDQDTRTAMARKVTGTPDPPKKQTQTSSQDGRRETYWIDARENVGLSYITISNEVHEDSDKSPTGWRPLDPGRLTAEIDQYLAKKFPAKKTWRRSHIADIRADIVRKRRPPGATAVAANRSGTIDLDTGVEYPGRLWSNRRIEYTGGQIYVHALPTGRLWHGTGRLPWRWYPQPKTITSPVRQILDAYELDGEEMDYVLGLIGRGLVGGADGGSPLPVLVGNPASGKSTLLRVVARTLAGRVAAIRSITDLASRFGLAEIAAGANTLILDDLADPTGADHQRGQKILNLLADGAEISVERKNRDSITFTPKVSCWLAANQPPLSVKSSVDGTSRRLRIIELDRQFDPLGHDPLNHLDHNDYESLANAAARAWPEWSHTDPPHSITARTRDVLDAGKTPIDRFLDRWSIDRTGHGTSIGLIRDAYQTETGEDITSQALGRSISRRFPTAKSRRQRIDGTQTRVWPITPRQ